MKELIFLIDTSGSMRGDNIKAVSRVVESIVRANDTDDSIRISVLFFSRLAQWLYPEFQLPRDFMWDEPQCFGLTSTGLALRKLAEHLEEYKADETLILLASDGNPTDDFYSALGELNEVDRFRSARRFALAIGQNVNLEILADWVDDPSHLIENDTDLAISLIACEMQ